MRTRRTWIVGAVDLPDYLSNGCVHKPKPRPTGWRLAVVRSRADWGRADWGQTRYLCYPFGQPLDSRQARLSVSGPGIVPGVPGQVPGSVAGGPRARRAALHRRAGGARRAPGLCPFSYRAALPGLGGLLQASVRRSRAGAGLPRALYPPHRDQPRAAPRSRRRHGAFPLPRLRPGQSGEGDASWGRGVPSAASCSTYSPPASCVSAITDCWRTDAAPSAWTGAGRLSASQRRNRGNRSRRRKPCCASPASISSAAPTAQKGGSRG